MPLTFTIEQYPHPTRIGMSVWRVGVLFDGVEQFARWETSVDDALAYCEGAR